MEGESATSTIQSRKHRMLQYYEIVKDSHTFGNIHKRKANYNRKFGNLPLEGTIIQKNKKLMLFFIIFRNIFHKNCIDTYGAPQNNILNHTS